MARFLMWLRLADCDCFTAVPSETIDSWIDPNPRSLVQTYRRSAPNESRKLVDQIAGIRNEKVSRTCRVDPCLEKPREVRS